MVRVSQRRNAGHEPADQSTHHRTDAEMVCVWGCVLK
jgi:hypothetical protein